MLDAHKPKLIMDKPPNNTINIDAGTIVLIIAALILLPLLLTGFISQ
ncbi:hypothetical protein NIES4102_19210 [Chondrocystis sp. NIES-4102]|nr:hypothetical protein NIES4102_19210 [Chondrocystis sp. NIES-4102]